MVYFFIYFCKFPLAFNSGLECQMPPSDFNLGLLLQESPALMDNGSKTIWILDIEMILLGSGC
uniref:Uncharacterized protein n=1 Tax=Rhizophagus irregularis (strain DAOM 181602 / DAOM 197198 / MUCL 43194) TaxID=747089 RepID=U9UDK9_RHIID